MEHQILPNLYGLKYVALSKAIEVLKSPRRRTKRAKP
jgi:hypothetical protein